MEEKSYYGRNPGGFHHVAYTEWGKPSAVAPLICVHGLTRNGRDFDTLAQNIEGERQVFCPDVVGRGKSDWLTDPEGYNTPQYLADMVGMIACTKAAKVDWIGTSMGGTFGIFLAADRNTPIRRLIINDIGPFISLLALKRIGAYVGLTKEFATFGEAEIYTREIYAGFGDLMDDQWRQLTENGMRKLPNGRYIQAYDFGIAKTFLSIDQDVDFWSIYDRITCPVLVLHGLKSDVLSAQVAEQMTRRGPRARVIEFPKTGHAPALMDLTQIAVIAEFLRS